MLTPMQPITLHSHIGSDGVLQIQVPEELKNQNVTVIIRPDDQNGSLSFKKQPAKYQI